MLLHVERVNEQYQVFRRNQVFQVLSELKGIVHCGVILVTLLGKASLWAGPEGSFQVLSARLELFFPPLTLSPAWPQPLWLWSGAEPQTFTPARHQGGNTDITTLTHTCAHSLTLTLWHTPIFTIPSPRRAQCATANGPFSRHPLLSNSPPPPLLFSFFHPHVGCQAAEKDFTHTYTPLCL